MEIAKQRIANWISFDYPPAILDLSGLGLTKFPPGLPSELQYLHLRNNQIREIPEALPSNLWALHLSNNQIREIPQTLPSCLYHLNLDNNQIREIPDTFPSGLYHLSLDNNQIREIPHTLSLKLSFLCLGGNPVSVSDKLQNESWSSYADRLTEEKAAARAAIRCLAIRDELCYAATSH